MAPNSAPSPVARHKKINLADKAAWIFFTAPGCVLASRCPGTSNSLRRVWPLAWKRLAPCPKSKAVALSTLIEAFIITGLCRVSPDLLGVLAQQIKFSAEPRHSSYAKLCGPLRSELGQLAANTSSRHSVPRQHSRGKGKTCSRRDSWSWDWIEGSA